MKKLTYKEAYDKIIEAYFKDEIKPFNPTFCFCGTLCSGDAWFKDTDFPRVVEHRNHSGYTGFQLGLMENALLKKTWRFSHNDAEWEDVLFDGMCDALEVLKQIHKERGEDVDGVQGFTKRKLDKVISD